MNWPIFLTFLTDTFAIIGAILTAFSALFIAFLFWQVRNDTRRWEREKAAEKQQRTDVALQAPPPPQKLMLLLANKKPELN